jgi:hypothetical protein
LVEAFFAGDHDRVTELGQAVVAEVVEQGGTYGDGVASGTLLGFDQQPDDPTEYLEGYVSPERLDALLDGEALTPDEQAVALDRWALSVLRDNPDYDRYPLWAVCSLTHPDGREAFIATAGTGCSFTEVSVGFLGAYSTAGEAMAAVQRLGYVSAADWQARHPGARRSC